MKAALGRLAALCSMRLASPPMAQVTVGLERKKARRVESDRGWWCQRWN